MNAQMKAESIIKSIENLTRALEIILAKPTIESAGKATEDAEETPKLDAEETPKLDVEEIKKQALAYMTISEDTRAAVKAKLNGRRVSEMAEEELKEFASWLNGVKPVGG